MPARFSFLMFRNDGTGTARLVQGKDFARAAATVKAWARQSDWVLVLGWGMLASRAEYLVAGVRVARDLPGVPPYRAEFAAMVAPRGLVFRSKGSCGVIIRHRLEGQRLASVLVRHVDGTLGVYRPQDLEPARGSCAISVIERDRFTSPFRSFFGQPVQCRGFGGVKGLCR